MKPLLSVESVKKYFPVERGLSRKVIGYVKAVDGVTFKLDKGKVSGIVGESGCGKTTLARIVLGLLKPTAGEVFFKGQDITALAPDKTRALRRLLQIVFQDPYNSLNPRMRIKDILIEPLIVHSIGNTKYRLDKAADLLSQVGLSAEFLNRYPHQFSGGERQRIGIARALATGPELVVCDEPVSSLDLSIQASILKLLMDLRARLNLSYLFISHDLRVIETISDNVMVMYLGKIFEFASTRDLYAMPIHPYTNTLFSAIAIGSERKKMSLAASGELPSPISPTTGCKFHTRCPYAEPLCKIEEPPLIEIKPGHFASCPPMTRRLI
ncbi:MAG: oligopeptide/dipeptide ABC transporter ATP-binding protein [Candidatus Omnitrophota bacterium]